MRSQHRKLRKKIRKIQNVVQFVVSKTAQCVNAYRTCVQKNSTDKIAYNNHCLMLECFSNELNICFLLYK